MAPLQPLDKTMNRVLAGDMRGSRQCLKRACIRLAVVLPVGIFFYPLKVALTYLRLRQKLFTFPSGSGPIVGCIGESHCNGEL
jgi:hypothetical protein